MLRSRLLVGSSIVAALVALCWLDHRSAIPGIWLAPVLLLLVVGAVHELLQLFVSNGLRPWPPAVYFGALLVALSPWGLMLEIACLSIWDPMLGTAFNNPSGPPGRFADGASQWMLFATAVAVLAVLVGEIVRYREPGRVTVNLAVGVFSVVYIGLLLSFLVRLRLNWGIGALASLIIVTKMGDTGAYFIGKAFGRHQLAPRLSPKKTIEGLIGAFVFSVAGAWAAAAWILPLTGPATQQSVPFLRWTVFAVVIAGFAVLGDLGESLIKRDSQRKESSAWMPGLGGILDMLDSILVAAPIAYGFWACGFVGS